MRLIIKQGPISHALEAQDEASTLCVDDIKFLLQSLTGIHPRGQKLIFKGKVLPGTMRLQEAGLVDNSKLMLIATPGVHQGEPALKTQKVVPAKSEARALPPRKREPIPRSQLEARKAAWAATGVVSLRDSADQQIPWESIWEVGDGARILDLGSNSLASMPCNISRLSNLQRLRLSGNQLQDGGLPWEALTSLHHLSILSLDNNQLTRLPPSINQLHHLQRLSLAHNAITDVPPEAGSLSQLVRLDLSHNRLTTVPASLGGCVALQELDLSCNCLSVLPATLGTLTDLRTLLLANNRLQAVPPEVLRGCSSLATLDLHGNPLTVEELREADGWREFDERRKRKYDKQVGFNVLQAGSGFDEGADAEQWERF